MRLKQLAMISMAACGLMLGGAAGAADKVKVEFWTMSLKPKFTPYFETLVKQYEAANPGVDLEWVDVPWDVLQSKLTAAIAAGSPPALVHLNVPWAYDYSQDGVIQPVDSLLGAERAAYAEGPIKDVTFNGKVYGFPHYNGANVTAYNTKLFQQAGLSKPPATLEEQLAAAKAIKAKTGQAGFSPALGKIAGIFLQEGLPLVENGKAVFNSPQHVALIAKFQDAYKSGALLKDKLFAEDNFQTSIDAYKSGRLGMMVAPPQALVRIRDDAKDVYAVTEIAAAPLGPTKVAAGGWLFHFAVPKGVTGATFTEAGKFAKFLTNDANQLEFSKLSGTFPTTRKAANDAHFQQAGNAGAFEKAVATGAKTMDSIRTLYVAGVPDFETLNKRLQDAVEAGVIGRKDIQASLNDAAAYWNSKLVAKK
ncbi:ABC transporter substrate-binding protein [Caldimonas brevitalea]|uniref:Sugar ABC transporter substrate-binding protein n=1 Tax=Caldimonas brevitalea TaxID=413882 RepID=A0A0G3BYL3_9BURK|nr:sugar ABC transporter substrate-binding protein [Caldimonas brevitalea]AKJ31620.1 sugar ABC transporter substrate-binding protein [Caldimonas brevitalea]